LILEAEAMNGKEDCEMPEELEAEEQNGTKENGMDTEEALVEAT
jgi:hypothetical protein